MAKAHLPGGGRAAEPREGRSAAAAPKGLMRGPVTTQLCERAALAACGDEVVAGCSQPALKKL